MKMGRPKKEDARHVKLNIRLTEEEKEVITKCAEKLNLSRTDAILKGIYCLMENNS